MPNTTMWVAKYCAKENPENIETWLIVYVHSTVFRLGLRQVQKS
jgi:hypothetical protein